LYVKWQERQNEADKQRRLLEHASANANHLESRLFGGFYYLLAARLRDYLNEVLEEVAIAMENFYRVRERLRAEPDEKSLKGFLMNILVETWLYNNYDWQAWVARMETD